MKTKTVCVGMLDASAVTREGYREIIIDLTELRRNLSEICQASNVPRGAELRLRVEHNGCSDSSCHECGGGALDVKVEYERPPTESEVERKAVYEAEHQAKLEKRRRRDYERLKKRYEG